MTEMWKTKIDSERVERSREECLTPTVSYVLSEVVFVSENGKTFCAQEERMQTCSRSALAHILL
jgi:hypothetical protein